MPYSFLTIEKNKTKIIYHLFFILILFYFLFFCFTYFFTKHFVLAIMEERGLYWQDFFHFTADEFLKILGFSLIFALFNWYASTYQMIERLIAILRAEPLASDDSYHQLYRNIVHEVSLATGGEKFEAMIIPTSAMNAFSLEDFSGRKIIGLTEGILARMNRSQVEAIVAHEAAHIIGGDCLPTTVLASFSNSYDVIFRFYKWILGGLVVLGSFSRYLDEAVQSFFVFWVLIIIVSLILFRVGLKIFNWMRFLISRQREYRADAMAVRLTRDPLSLAEALYSIRYHWRGAHLPGEKLESLFIMNPRFIRLDESEGGMADLYSTHPPLVHRLKILLDMAKEKPEDFEAHFLKKTQKTKVFMDSSSQKDRVSTSDPEWLIHKTDHWVGPFKLEDIQNLSWLAPHVWVKKMGEPHIQLAQDDESIQALFEKEGGIRKDSILCPHCDIQLSSGQYEGLNILRCSRCQGVLVKRSYVDKILIRDDVGFAERIIRMANSVKDSQLQSAKEPIFACTESVFFCPLCHNNRIKLQHRFYSKEFRVEVDYCVFCDVMWFDKDELEILQYLIEDVEKKNK